MSHIQKSRTQRIGDGSDLQSPYPKPKFRRGIAIPLLFLMLATLACGSFVPRPTPVPRPTATPTEITGSISADSTATPTLLLATSVPTLDAPTATLTPTPLPGTAIVVGQSARVIAEQGLNVRKSAGASGERAGRYPPEAIVSVLEGPVDVDGYRWWRVGNNELAGWVAEGDGSVTWLSPDLGGTQPVDRSIQVGDRVLVTVGDTGKLKVRATPSTAAAEVRQISNQTELTITEGPVEADGYIWWRVTNSDNSLDGWAAEGDGDNTWLTPVE